MISRVFVAPVIEDPRAHSAQKSFVRLSLSGKVTSVFVVDTYTFDVAFKAKEIEKVASAVTNPGLETFSIGALSKLPKFSFAIEIGFKPGVTDNVATTVREMVGDITRRQLAESEAIASSRVFFVSGSITKKDAEIIALSLHNPLIEHAAVIGESEVKKNGLPMYLPRVVLESSGNVSVVSLLTATDDELKEIGEKGIKNTDGSFRGPLALELDYMKVIQAHFKTLGRNPTDIELESLAQTWSEHCKHTIFANPIEDAERGIYKTYIKGATEKIRAAKGKKDFCVSVFSDNAGGIAFDDDYVVTHKVETHNSPSALDPFGGAITGIVGVNRDTIGFGLGAKPVANVYGFCFGYPTDTRPLYRTEAMTEKLLSPERIMEGVIKGVNVGGNCSGIPTVHGFLHFDDDFRGKPLVFAGTVGLIPRIVRGKLSHEKEARPGDYVVVIGGRVGADGIHGATFSSVVLDQSSPATAVQIGDPITQKKLSDMIVKEARDQGLYSSITDNGAGGISCSVAEMARECGGAVVDLEKVPLKYPGLDPWQIWISESQERMTLAVPKGKWEAFKKLALSRGVEATVIGEFKNSGNMTVRFRGDTVMDIALEFLHNGLPKKNLEVKKPTRTFSEPKRATGKNLTLEVLKILARENIGSTEFVSKQYDHEVQAGSVLKPTQGRGRVSADAEIFRPVLSSKKAVVLTSALFPSYSRIDTYTMAAQSLDAAIRQAVVTGAPLNHLAILDNFCWSSSGNPERLYELREAARACYDFAVAYGTPLISGKDSMWNDFRGYDEKGEKVHIAAPPTLLISAIGVMKDAAQSISIDVKMAGDVLYLLGETDKELGASEYFASLSGKKATKTIGGELPQVSAKKNLKLYKAYEKARPLVSSAISVGRGGFASALSKTLIAGGFGAAVSLSKVSGSAKAADELLFSESSGRILVSVSPKNARAFEKSFTGIPFAKIGTVSDKQTIVVTLGSATIMKTTLGDLTKAYRKPFKKYE
jgi:phosphoribosylformylglycinamidine synthase II